MVVWQARLKKTPKKKIFFFDFFSTFFGVFLTSEKSRKSQEKFMDFQKSGSCLPDYHMKHHQIRKKSGGISAKAKRQKRKGEKKITFRRDAKHNNNEECDRSHQPAHLPLKRYELTGSSHFTQAPLHSMGKQATAPALKYPTLGEYSLCPPIASAGPGQQRQYRWILHPLGAVRPLKN